MTNAEFFQTLINQVDETVGVDSSADGSLGLFHILAMAHDWCAVKGVDFDATLAEVKESLANED